MAHTKVSRQVHLWRTSDARRRRWMPSPAGPPGSSLEVCPGEPSSLESVWRRPAAMCLVAGAGTRSAAAGLTNRQRCASHGPRPPTPHAASHIPRAGRPVNSAHPVANSELCPRHPIRPSPRGRKNRSSHYGYRPRSVPQHTQPKTASPCLCTTNRFSTDRTALHCTWQPDAAPRYGALTVVTYNLPVPPRDPVSSQSLRCAMRV